MGALVASLAVLASVDSTSFGTLLIPLWMVLAPRVRPVRLLLYLAVVAGFYFSVGVALLYGVDALDTVLSGRWLDLPGVRVVQLAAGVALLGLSIRVDRSPADGGPSPRARHWQEALTAPDARPAAVVVVALAATTVEIATMLPYLAAIGMLSSAEVGGGLRLALLAAYVAVMVAPALLALGARLLLPRAVEPSLCQLSDWMTAHAASMTSWVLAIVGALVALDALQNLGILDS